MRKRAAETVLRNATAALLAAALALTAVAADPEIPQKLLDHEARTRAAFSPAQRARVQALEAQLTTKMSVPAVTSMTQGCETSEMLAVMMAYIKMLNKEAREDRKGSRLDAEMPSKTRATKLKQDNQKIDQQMREAQEKATNLMDAANTGMVMGVVGGGTQLAAARLVTLPTRTPTKVPGAAK